MTPKSVLSVASVAALFLALFLWAGCGPKGSSSGSSKPASQKAGASIQKFTPLTWHQTLEPSFGAATRDALLQQAGGNQPEDVEFVKGAPDQFPGEVWFALRKAPVVTSDDIVEVRSVRTEFGDSVEFTLSPAAGDRFRQFTRGHIGERIAVVLDHQVITNPRVNSEIGEKGSITGNFTPQEIEALVERLRK